MRASVFILSAAIALCCSCKSSHAVLEFEKYTMDNGLEVILHEDKSDPIVAVAIQYRVGSANEKTGKTGFAHFFEHMLFQRSENLPRNTFFSKIDELGGTFNGGTSNDFTRYYEVIPRDALEKILWMESDRMGFFINTVTQGGLEREIDVVSNEKRQRESGPYGHYENVLVKYFYPEGHPYSWSVIGEIEDLQSATVEDVKEFYNKFYTPANATLVIAGDFDKAQTKALIEKYFGEIKGGPKPEPVPVQRVSLDDTRKVYYEDQYADAPMIQVAFPSVEQFHEDTYALHFLIKLLSADKKSPLQKIIVEENKYTNAINSIQMAQAVSGMLWTYAVTYPDVNLDDVYKGIQEAFERFEKDGINPDDLKRYKTQYENGLYRRLTGILVKCNNIVTGNTFAGEPDKVFTEVDKYLSVTEEDIMRVYEKYIKGKNHVVVSLVPKGRADLAVSGSVPAEIKTESIDEQKTMSKAGEIIDDPYEYTPSLIDRTKEPELLANTPELNVPAVWNMTLKNGIEVKGINYDELPLVYFSFILNRGASHDSIEKAGAACITATMLKEGGTTSLSPEELEEALGMYGASVGIFGSSEGTYLSGQCLEKDFAKVMEIVSDIIINPGWDEEEFAIAKESVLDELRQSKTAPKTIANDLFRKLLWGKNHIFGYSSNGTEETVASLTLDDIKDFYAKYYSPSITKMTFVGGLSKAEVKKAVAPLVRNWKAKEVEMPELGVQNKELKQKIYFVDYPGSGQSYILIGNAGLSQKDKDAYAAEIINDKLGASSSAILFNELRLKRGYTYGAYSSFSSGLYNNSFKATSSVQATATKPSVELFLDLIGNYGKNYTEEMLANTVNSMKKATYGNMEDAHNLQSMLVDIFAYGLDDDYLKKQEEELVGMTLDKAHQTIGQYLDINKMVIIVVGDAKTQYKPLTKLGIDIELTDPSSL